jgi:CxxC-x17-CxxC domain-containing protein
MAIIFFTGALAMAYADRTLTCRDCGQEFVFTVGEQEFFDQKGFTNAPTRCSACRSARKSSGGYSGGGYSDGGPREMHTAICSQCGKEAKVPFVPRGDRPVFCTECFQSQRREQSSW